MKKTATYVCSYCSRKHVYLESDKREIYFCPACGHKMNYLFSEDIDETTGLLIKGYEDKIRAADSPECGDTHNIQCPNCQNRNVQKVKIIEKFASILTLGILFTCQPFKCKNCGYIWGRR